MQAIFVEPTANIEYANVDSSLAKQIRLITFHILQIFLSSKRVIGKITSCVMFVNTVILFAWVRILSWRNLEIRIRLVAFVALVDLIDISIIYPLRRFKGLFIPFSVRRVFTKIFERSQVFYARFGVNCGFFRSIYSLKLFCFFMRLFSGYSALKDTFHLGTLVLLLGILPLHLNFD